MMRIEAEFESQIAPIPFGRRTGEFEAETEIANIRVAGHGENLPRANVEIYADHKQRTRSFAEGISSR